jgi:hypothetical protein
MKRVPALLLCLALAAMILQPVPSNVNSPSVNTPQLADDPPPPFPPRPPTEMDQFLLADDPPPPFPPRPPTQEAMAV